VAALAALAVGCGEDQQSALCERDAVVAAGFRPLPAGLEYGRLPPETREQFTSRFEDTAPFSRADARSVHRGGERVAAVLVAAPDGPEPGAEMEKAIMTGFDATEQERAELPAVGTVLRSVDSTGFTAYARAVSSCAVVVATAPEDRLARRVAATVLR
jgi:hypothetical protein